MTTRINNINDIKQTIREEYEREKKIKQKFYQCGKSIAKTDDGKYFFKYIFNRYYKSAYTVVKNSEQLNNQDVFFMGIHNGKKNLLNEILIPFVEKDVIDLLTTGEEDGESK